MNQKLKRAAAAAAALALAFAAWSRLKDRDFRYAGTVEATEVSLSPRLSSTIAKVAVREGDAVQAGQVLVELACEDVRLAADIAQREFKRSEQLYKEGAAPFEAFDRDRNRRDDTALKLSWCRVESPLAGTVLARLHEPGELVAPGTKLLTLADLAGVYAYVFVPQGELHRLKPGAEVQAFLPEAGREARRGRIAFIRPQAEFTPKNVQTREERTRLVYGVKVELDNADGALKPGMPVEVLLPL
ncbi:HlyD family efflux transporter periplasmic adaptor subunit [bacterium]|nr:MAG: HlyD family efflux transporter periplasmic adaptor subunit [bacterium]